MLELNALRMAVQEYERAETDDERARAAARVKQLINPQLVRIIFARLDELEERLHAGTETDVDVGLEGDSEAGTSSYEESPPETPV